MQRERLEHSWLTKILAQNFPEARRRLEDLKRGVNMSKMRVSHTAFNRQKEGECSVM